MKKTFKLFLVLLFFSFFAKVFVTGLTPVVLAVPEGCDVEAKVYKPGIWLWKLNLQRTIWNSVNGISVAANTQAGGLSPNQVMLCQEYAKAKVEAMGLDGSSIPEACKLGQLSQAEQDKVEEVCDAYSASVAVPDVQQEVKGDSVLVDSVNSSFLGIANKLEGAAHKEPLPVNFAYYWNQEVSKIPFAGRALAADNDAYENLPILKAVYDIWKIFLSVSLALLSLVLLYTGIMITMGKKISTQLVVNVQYAIPKIVIGAILIIFSYPIGAAITSVSFGLYRGADDIFYNLVKQSGASLVVPPSGLITTIIITTIFAGIGGGSAILIFGLLFLLATILVKLILYAKVLIIYMKMAISVVSAPIEFVMGTIPGNDDKIKEWFLRMAKYGLTLFGMGIVIPATLWTALKIALAYLPGGSSEVGGWGVAVSILLPFIIILFGYSIAINMEKKVDEMFFGKKKK